MAHSPAAHRALHWASMPGIRIERRHDGRRSVRLIGCCGDPDRMRRDDDRAFLEQELAAGGRLVSSGPDGVELRDSRGRTHVLHPGAGLPSA
jgi:hypothetical protein